MSWLTTIGKILVAVIPEALRAKREGDRQNTRDDANEKAQRDRFEREQRERRKR